MARTEMRVSAISDYSLPWYSRLFRPVSRFFFRMLFRILSRVQITGIENIPAQGGYVIVGNHVSIYEPALITSFWPRNIEVAGAVEVRDLPIQGQIFRLYGTIPVHRERFDRRLLDTIVEVLAAGRPVLIFPEGTRSHTPGMQQASTGAVYVAAKAGVNIIPVDVSGTDVLGEAIGSFRRTELNMVIGEEILLPEIPWRSVERKEILREQTDRVMHAIRDLLPQGYHGVYAKVSS
jgi:1-acyl-sn-glycerol-3-phosphate acyltransferase